LNADQQELFVGGVGEADVMQMRTLLASGGWLKRKDFMAQLGWPERKVPAVAELLGGEIVRSRTRGFKLTALLTPDEVPVAIHTAQEVLSQCRKNAGYAIALRKRVHQLVG
jgi:hypothetical protein